MTEHPDEQPAETEDEASAEEQSPPAGRQHARPRGADATPPLRTATPRVPDVTA